MRHAPFVRRVILAAIAAIIAAHCAPIAPAPACGVRFTIPPPPGTQFSPVQIPAVSPDGAGVAFTAISSDGIQRLWIHSLRRSVATVVPGTESGSFPFWSPDGGSLGFFADDRLKRVEVSSGTIQVLADARDGRGASWSAWGIILSAASGAQSRAIFGLPASGGPLRQRTNLSNDPDERHFWPAFLPDSEHFVYSATRRQRRETFLGSVRSNERIRFLGGGSPVAAVGRHALLFAGGDVLLKYRFNEKLLVAEGPAELVTPAVARGPSGLASFSASAEGTAIVYGRSGAEIVWLDQDGKETPAIPDPGYSHPRLSPSGEQILVSIGPGWLGPGAGRYYVYDIKSDRWRRIIDGFSGGLPALWSADDGEIVLTALTEDGKAAQVLAVRTDGSGAVRKLLDLGAGAHAAAISRAGSLLAIVEPSDNRREHLGIRIVTLEGGRPLGGATVWQSAGASNYTQPALSPDGRWVSYVSNQSGMEEVYVSALSASATPWQISSGGGTAPVWTGDGRRLFYRGGDGLHAVTTAGSPATWAAHDRVVVLDEFIGGRLDQPSEFDVAPDGSRVLLSRRPDPNRPPELIGLASCGAGRVPLMVP